MIFKSGDWITPGDLELPMRRGSDVTEGAAAVERHGVPAAKAVLSWLQREALRIASERSEVRRSDIVARCRISREVARRELVGLVRLGLLLRIGFGRGARYVPLSWWLTIMSDMAGWAMASI
jgi:predicted HTH transcriptional regulator